MLLVFGPVGCASARCGASWRCMLYAWLEPAKAEPANRRDNGGATLNAACLCVCMCVRARACACACACVSLCVCRNMVTPQARDGRLPALHVRPRRSGRSLPLRLCLRHQPSRRRDRFEEAGRRIGHRTVRTSAGLQCTSTQFLCGATSISPIPPPRTMLFFWRVTRLSCCKTLAKRLDDSCTPLRQDSCMQCLWRRRSRARSSSMPVAEHGSCLPKQVRRVRGHLPRGHFHVSQRPLCALVCNGEWGASLLRERPSERQRERAAKGA